MSRAAGVLLTSCTLLTFSSTLLLGLIIFLLVRMTQRMEGSSDNGPIGGQDLYRGEIRHREKSSLFSAVTSTGNEVWYGSHGQFSLRDTRSLVVAQPIVSTNRMIPR